MSRRQFLFELAADDSSSTFANDENLPALPLPSLDATLDRYYESLRPFGTDIELANSRRIIADFRSGVGRRLHAAVEKRALRERNWLQQWWEDYAYCSDRTPIVPFSNMLGAFPAQLAGIQQDRAGYVRQAARLVRCSIEYWDLIRKERMRPATNPAGTVTFSSFLLKRLFQTYRVPGERMDSIVSQFRTEREERAGDLPERHPEPVIIVIGRGRMFVLEVLQASGEICSAQQLLPQLEQIVSKMEVEPAADCPVAVLTCDNRTAWSANRDHLRELSAANADTLRLVESSLGVVVLDQHEPRDYNELCLANMAGDLESRWADASCTSTVYRNGRLGCGGEHACYDGTISMAFMVYVMLTLMEEPEPDWTEVAKVEQVPVPRELRWDVDDWLRGEVERVWSEARSAAENVMASCEPFLGFGKGWMKEQRLAPDSFVQMILQLVYYRMHGE